MAHFASENHRTTGMDQVDMLSQRPLALSRFGNAPNHVNRPIGAVLLQHKNTWTQCKLWIILHDDRRRDAVNYVAHKYIIRSSSS
jgi:hypothetical protein